MDDYVPLLEEELALPGDDRRAPAVAQGRPRSRPRLPVAGHRRGHVGHPHRVPARAGRRRLHGHREERRRRRHLVREHVSRLSGRHPQPQLQLLVRAAPRLAAPLLRPSRCCTSTSATAPATSACASTSASAPRCARPPGTTTDRARGRSSSAIPTDRRDPRRQRGGQRGRPAQPAALPGDRRHRHVRRRVVPLRAVGPRRRPRRQARRGDRHRCQRGAVHPRDRPAPVELFAVPAHAAWLGPDARLPRRGPRRPRWLYAHVPTYSEWNRFWMFWRMGDGSIAGVRVDPDWDRRTAPSAPSTTSCARCSPRTCERRVRRPARPRSRRWSRTYPPGAKRMLRDNGVWAATLKRDNVDLVTDEIREITPTGIVTADGTEHDVDVIVYGTGFQASNFLTPMQVTGRGGVDLHEHWDGDARAYLGITIPGFPNFFCLYGPNTNIVDQRQHHLLLRVRRALHPRLPRAAPARRTTRALDVRKDVHDEFNEQVDAENRLMAWGWSDVQQLVQERTRPGRPELAVHAARVLAAHPRTRPRRLRRQLRRRLDARGPIHSTRRRGGRRRRTRRTGRADQDHVGEHLCVRPRLHPDGQHDAARPRARRRHRGRPDRRHRGDLRLRRVRPLPRGSLQPRAPPPARPRWA